MPIRLRLTLWNSFLFGIIIAIVIGVVYFTHRQSTYNDVDNIVSNIVTHVKEEVTRQLEEGKRLQNVNVSVNSFSGDEIAVMIRDKQRNLVYSNSHTFLQNHKKIEDQIQLRAIGFDTIYDENDIKIRLKNSLINIENTNVGSIQVFFSLESVDKELKQFKWFVISLALVGIFLASIAGWVIAKKTLRRVDLIAKTAKAIAHSQNFKHRVLHIGALDEIGYLTETFNDMLDSLEKVYMNQQRFLSDASHELRAPLTTIRGNLDLLHKMSSIPDAEKKEILNDMSSEAVRMSKLVSDLLSLARADAGQTLDKNIINLSRILIQVIDEMTLWDTSQTITSKIEDNIHIWGNSNSIKQLLIILMENALKYTSEKGLISVKITTYEKKALISIEDNGIGIESKEIPFVFERFYRTDTARQYAPDGTGLGLSIAKWIVEEHNGEIQLKSYPGEGTTIDLLFPLINYPSV